MSLAWLDAADRLSPWPQAHVLVVGIGASGFAAADALLEVGAKVTVVADNDDSSARERGTLLEILGATVRLGPGSSHALIPGVDLVVTSPGLRPTTPVLAQASQQRIPVWGEVELAWRFMFPDRVVPWLCVTGTNGKTTTTQMLESMLLAGGFRAAAVGNIGRPVMEAVLDRETRYDVFAVELSSFQLHWSSSLRPHSSVVLNLQPDHLEWYAHAADPMAAYRADKATIYHQVSHACVYNVADPATEQMVTEADVVEGARAIGFTLGIPSVSMLGVVEDLIVDRAFVTQRRTSALELASVADVQPAAPHNIANALAAAALARSFGCGAPAVAQGLRRVSLGGHRIETVAEIDRVRYVDDSKATNPHAAEASLLAFDSVVWIAGGQAKGVSMDDLVARHASRLRAAILLGVDRHLLAEALARHAPDVPVIVIDDPETKAMDEAVRAAAGLARPGDTVLLAPGCASLDMWTSYAARGDQFAHAVRSLRS